MANETEKRVFVALINDAGQVLIIKRSAFVNNPGTLGLPGGHMDDGETVEQGARRELFEELGLDIDFEKRSFVKVHADKKRTILVAKMPKASQYAFDLDENEIECIYWMRMSEIESKVDGWGEEGEERFHRSLELALPILTELKPMSIRSAFTRDRIHLLEIDDETVEC